MMFSVTVIFGRGGEDEIVVSIASMFYF